MVLGHMKLYLWLNRIVLFGSLESFPQYVNLQQVNGNGTLYVDV